MEANLEFIIDNFIEKLNIILNNLIHFGEIKYLRGDFIPSYHWLLLAKLALVYLKSFKLKRNHSWSDKSERPKYLKQEGQECRIFSPVLKMINTKFCETWHDSSDTIEVHKQPEPETVMLRLRLNRTSELAEFQSRRIYKQWFLSITLNGSAACKNILDFQFSMEHSAVCSCRSDVDVRTV